MIDMKSEEFQQTSNIFSNENTICFYKSSENIVDPNSNRNSSNKNKECDTPSNRKNKRSKGRCQYNLSGLTANCRSIQIPFLSSIEFKSSKDDQQRRNVQCS